MVIKKVDQGVILILDVSRNAATPEEKSGKSFFENARECATRIIERKILSQGKDYVGVMLLGSKKTKNLMAEQCKGAFKRIDMLFELDVPTWKMIRELPDTPSQNEADWVDALIVAAEHFKNLENVKILNQKIILMTNFLTPTLNSPKDIQMVLDGFKEENLEVDVIGIDLYNEEGKTEDFDLAKQFVEVTDGTTASFDFTMKYLLFHKKKANKAAPWNVDLSIGPNIKIPVTSYIKIKDEYVIKNWKKAIKDPVTKTASSSEAIVKSTVYTSEAQKTFLSTPEIIKGYHYGQKVIPLTETDKSMLYESGEKCLSVYGFTKASNINWQCLTGDGLSYVFGRKGDKKAQQAIRCLVECLHELNLVGIVRRVYNKNNAPKMFVLMPVIDTNNYICLSMIALCFKDDIKYMSFPTTNLKRFACTDKQVNAFKDLIKAMDLTRAYDETFDDTEAFPIAQTFSPLVQYLLDSIAFRAMNPDKPLPQPRDDVMNLFKVPPLVEERSKIHLEELKSLFVLNKVEKKTRKKAPVLDDDVTMPVAGPSDQQENSMPKITLPVKTDNIEHITTLDPVGDYNKLKSKKSLTELAPEMISAIESLIYCNLDGNYAKPFEAITKFRKDCSENDPSLYNNWLKTFKTVLNERNKQDILNMISEKNLNFILKSENNLSSYETEESENDTQLYENDTIPNSAELTIQSEVKNLFDDF